jgi:hypothetical protein
MPHGDAEFTAESLASRRAILGKTKGRPAIWTAFLSRENSPNGGSKSHQNFLAKSYWPLKGSVKEFLQNKCLCFQWFNQLVNIFFKVTLFAILWVGSPQAIDSSAT